MGLATHLHRWSHGLHGMRALARDPDLDCVWRAGTSWRADREGRECCDTFGLKPSGLERWLLRMSTSAAG